MVCTFLVVTICSRFRFIHPIHVVDLFGCSIDQANIFLEKLLKRNILKIDHLEGLGVGMNIGGHGYYLYSISKHARNTFLLNCPYYENGIRVRKTYSAKTIHDLIALRIALVIAGLVSAVDIISDFSTGLIFRDGDKIPDVFLRTHEKKVIWVEMEYSPKSGNELKYFCENTINSILSKKMNETYIVFDTETAAKRYRRELDNIIYENNIGPLPQIKIIQSKAVCYLDAFGGQVINIDQLTSSMFRKDHVPHALVERFNARRRSDKNKTYQLSSFYELRSY